MPSKTLEQYIATIDEKLTQYDAETLDAKKVKDYIDRAKTFKKDFPDEYEQQKQRIYEHLEINTDEGNTMTIEDAYKQLQNDDSFIGEERLALSFTNIFDSKVKTNIEIVDWIVSNDEELVSNIVLLSPSIGMVYVETDNKTNEPVRRWKNLTDKELETVIRLMLTYRFTYLFNIIGEKYQQMKVDEDGMKSFYKKKKKIDKLSSGFIDTFLSKNVSNASQYIYNYKFDNNEEIFPLADGVNIDLRSGIELERTKDQYVSKCSPWTYEDYCSVDDKKIDEIKGWFRKAQPDNDIFEFLLRILGWWLTGKNEQKFVVFFGREAGNGKSTIFKLVRNVFGNEMSCDLARDLIFKSKNSKDNQYNPALIWLKSTRFAVLHDTMEGDTYGNSIKPLVSRDTISTRKIQGNDMNVIVPKLNIGIGCNSNPSVDKDDLEAIKRRMIIMYFNVCFREKKVEPKVEETEQKKDEESKLIKLEAVENDKTIDTKINQKEYVIAMLHLMVQSAKIYLQNGLKEPVEINDNNSVYSEDMKNDENDGFEELFKSSMIDNTDEKATMKCSHFKQLYKDFCFENNFKMCRNYNQRLKSLGIKVKQIGGRNHICGYKTDVKEKGLNMF